MGNNIDTQTHRKLVTWLVAQSMIIIFSSIVAFLSVELAANYIFIPPDKQEGFFQILYRTGGTIIPMSVLLGLINNYLSKIVYGYIETIADSLKKLANGDFTINLDTKKSGPFAMVYKNINKTSEELAKVELLKKNFVNNYSHEFKTPITSIQGFAELLLEENIDPDMKNQCLSIIAEEAGRLAQMADTTILLSKLNSQSIITDKKKYSLDDQIRKCAVLFLQQAKDEEIDFKVDLEECIYNGNENLMNHIWINILNNAFKFTPRNGEISIKLKVNKVDNSLSVFVIDNGIGMRKEVRKNIFSQYYQANTNSQSKGLGLGLTIVNEIVTQCEGDIIVISQENKGTSFEVKLPLNR